MSTNPAMLAVYNTQTSDSKRLLPDNTTCWQRLSPRAIDCVRSDASCVFLVRSLVNSTDYPTPSSHSSLPPYHGERQDQKKHFVLCEGMRNAWSARREDALCYRLVTSAIRRAQCTGCHYCVDEMHNLSDFLVSNFFC